MVLAQLASAHHSAVYPLGKTLTVQFEALGLLARTHIGDFMGQVRPQSEAVGTALGRTGEGRQEAVAVVAQALPSHEAHAVVDLGSHHMRLYLRVLLLLLA